MAICICICIFVRIFTVEGSSFKVAHLPPPGNDNFDNSDGDAYFDFDGNRGENYDLSKYVEIGQDRKTSTWENRCAT